MQEKYKELHKLSRHAKVLKGIASLLDWDQETYMPEGGNSFRAEQQKTLAGLIHQEKTSPHFAKALGSLIDLKSGKIKASSLTLAKKRSLELWRRDYIKEVRLPQKFVEEFTTITSKAHLAWRHAKTNSSFKEFAPFLKKIVALCRKRAEYIGYDEHPYDALIDDFEPGMTTKEIITLFDQVKVFSSTLVKKHAKVKTDNQFLYGNFDKDLQMELGTAILKDMGYDFQYGRIDFSAHPFSSSSSPKDSRITTRIPSKNIMTNISTLLHEGGHSLYEMGLPEKEFGTPLGESVSLGIHESQSRFWEIWIGHSKPFWNKYFPILQKTFKGQFDKINSSDFYKGINKITPSLIRVDADEVTYPLHVILRFEIEKELIEGSIQVEDIPSVWNEKMKTLIGVVPKNDQEGCLQDIHWSMGAFGYFPTYALGSLYAAQLFEAFVQEYPDYEQRIKNGMQFIREFLEKKIYRFGRLYDSKELIKKATGKPFSSDAYKRYLEAKY